MTVLFDTGAVNFNSAAVSGGSGASGGGGTTSSSGLAYGGTPRAIPGTVQAEDFDTGGAGVSFGDSSAGNSGGQYRQTNVDIESASGGGYDVGWIAAGEFLNYTVNVASSGSYTVRLRVASPYGGSLHFGLGAPSNVWTGVNIPPTGGWQSWTDVSLPVTLAAGTQLMTLKFDTGGFNLDRVAVDTGSTSTTSGGGSSAGGSPTDLTVVAWNLHVDSTSAHARAVMDQVAAMSPQPQIVIVEEAWRAVYSDYINELQARTGKTWYGAFGTHCPSGAWNGSYCTSSENEGVGVFSTYPIVNSETKLLPYADDWHSARAAVRAAVNVNGVIVQVFAIHLQPTYVAARANSMALLKSWAGGFSTPQIMGGDFNATPDEVDTASNMGTGFVDSWSQVGGWSGNTAFTPSPWMKIDFVLEDWSGKAQPTWSNVLSSTGTISDHSPVITSYTVRP
jgi:endonuclease/exonuclease/phosphatase family metal-dependent hydrolase